MFFCEFCDISKNAFFIEHLWWLVVNMLKKEDFLTYLEIDICLNVIQPSLNHPSNNL